MLPDEKLTNGELKDAWKDESVLQKTEIDEETRKLYQKVFEKDTTFGERLGNFIRAENKAGRQAKIIKDFLLVFVPYGRTISNATEMATEIISDNTMSEQAKPAPKSKTVIAFGLLFLAGLLQLLGVDIGLELSADAQWVSTGVGIVGVILRLVTNKPVKLGEALGLTKN